MRKSSRHPSHRPTHPAEILLDDLEALGVSKTALSKSLGISRNTLYNLLEQRQGVTPEMAVRLSVVTGSSPEFWLNLQIAHDLWKAQKKVDTSKLKRLLPVRKAAA